jgi:predicted enzyme involved in methoxymalonyl-ACP biosynthesis
VQQARAVSGLDTHAHPSAGTLCCHRWQLPQVHVVLMPRDPETWMASLQYGAWPLVQRRARATDEDSKRTQMYEEQMQRHDAAARAASLAALLASLQVRVDVEHMSEGEAEQERLAQLAERTNQFNGAAPLVPDP